MGYQIWAIGQKIVLFRVIPKKILIHKTAKTICRFDLQAIKKKPGGREKPAWAERKREEGFSYGIRIANLASG
ncbi:hypothetical protein BFS05_05875 [Gardnerella vaginalis]|uniref:Uncharacterized protein n=1 Tax=Gardnerella vaginalis TaxID=2702 RepID=A0A2K1STN2_GARVA|nr:hypothetical protein BFS05_05875 [Gardnerella vaginalis]